MAAVSNIFNVNLLAGANANVLVPESLGQFKSVIGDLPIFEANVNPNNAHQDLANLINGGSLDESDWTCACCCLMTGFGVCYVASGQFLVDQGQYGFAMNNGVPRIFFAGRHVLLHPFNHFVGVYNIGSDYINVGPVTICRVPQGQIGLAYNNARVEILLPGVHCRNDAAFRFDRLAKMDEELIEFGPIKFLIVRSGGVRVCYYGGKVSIFNEGRYAINSNTFVVTQLINTQQQNLRFNRHKVLLDGGISLFVEGLLTFQVTDVEQLIHQIGDRDLRRSVEDVTKAELARVFASIHLEQISSSVQQAGAVKEDVVLGAAVDSTNEGEARAKICERVIYYVRPTVGAWGVSIINFQLESTALADEKYAQEYEASSLQLAKANANLRALAAQNQLMITKAKAEAEAVRLAAEGTKNQSVLQAQAKAEALKIEAAAKVAAAQSEKEALLIKAAAEASARVIEGNSRNDAAKAMPNEFARQYALQSLNVEFARSLKAQTLTVMADSLIGKSLVAQGAFSASENN